MDEKEKIKEENKENEENEEDKELIQYTGNFGWINQESKFWDDLEEMGEDELLRHKIIKLKIFTGDYSGKKAIFGIDVTYKNLSTGEIKKTQEHRGSEQFLDSKEIEIKANEYLIDFHIRFTDECEYISQLGFTTNQNHAILEGSEEGQDKTITSNGGDNIIIGTFGCLNKKLDAMGCLFISKKEYFKRKLFRFFMLRNLAKKDEKFKKTWDEKYNELPNDFKYLWRTINLPNTVFAPIIKYCYL